MTSMTHKLEESTLFLKNHGIKPNAIGIVLGTGLGDLVEHIKIEKEIPFDKIPL